jgi:hypothetical protein
VLVEDARLGDPLVRSAMAPVALLPNLRSLSLSIPPGYAVLHQPVSLPLDFANVISLDVTMAGGDLPTVLSSLCIKHLMAFIRMSVNRPAVTLTVSRPRMQNLIRIFGPELVCRSTTYKLVRMHNNRFAGKIARWMDVIPLRPSPFAPVPLVGWWDPDSVGYPDATEHPGWVKVVPGS